MIEKIINYVKENALLSLVFLSLFFIFIVWLFCNTSKDEGTSNYTFSDIRDPDNYKIPAIMKKKEKKYSKGETECRRVLENIFRKPFTSRRPDFMFNSETRHNLELDMYNKDLRLACEYNGKQHYEYTPYFHRNNIQNFYKQQQRDNMKRNICNKLGIRLIEVPYTVKIEDIENYIKMELKKFQ